MLPYMRVKWEFCGLNAIVRIYEKNNDINSKTNAMPCCVLVCLSDTQQTVALMRKMWVRRTAERQLSHIARDSPT